MNLTPDDIHDITALLTSILDNRGSPLILPEQINIMVALFQMLNTFNNNMYTSDWAMDQCRNISGTYSGTDDIVTARNEINNAMINMANAADAPQGSSTILKVEWYRRAFLYCLGMGVSFVTLQAIAPDSVSLILDYSYSLFKTLLSQTINGSILTGPSIAAGAGQANPFSAGAFAAAAGNLAANAAALTATAATSLVNVAFTACAQAVSSCAYLLGNLANSNAYEACLLFTRDTFVFAAEVATTAAAAKGASKAGKSLYETAMGESDAAIARYIDNGGPSRDFDAVKNAALQAYLSAENGVFEAINTSFDDMSKINDNFYNASPEWVQNRFLAPLVNDIINDAFGKAVMESTPLYRTTLGTLISDLSQQPIYAFDDDYVQNTLMSKYNIPKDPSNQRYINFRALITLWILATVKPDSMTRQRSLPRPGTKYNPKVFKSTSVMGARSSSLPLISYKRINNPQEIKLGNNKNNEGVIEMKRIKQVTFHPDLIRAIKRNGVTMDYIIYKALNEPLGMLSKEDRAQIISEFDNAKLKHSNKEKPIAGNYSDINNKKFNMDLVLDDVTELLRKLGYDLSKAVNKYAGGQKSMHNKKRPKRSTIRRKKVRQVRRKTLKGMKRRYTKKRR